MEYLQHVVDGKIEIQNTWNKPDGYCIYSILYVYNYNIVTVFWLDIANVWGDMIVQLRAIAHEMTCQ